VSQVAPGSPAEKAGIERGDVILRFGDKPIVKMRDLSRAVAATPVGQETPVLLRRGDEEKTIEVTVDQLGEQAAGRPAPQTARSGSGALGIGVQELDDALRQRLDLGADVEGVVVVEVDPMGPAARAGVEPGDLIVEVDREPVANVSDLEKRLEAAGEDVVLLVRRGEATLFIGISR
jgi:serine protease Do